MGFSLGTAEVGVDLNDKGLLAGLKNAERRVSETVKRIDAMRGEAEIGADISEADRKMDEVRERIAQLENKRATLKVKADISEATREMAAARAQLRALDHEKATLKVEMSERSKLTSRFLRDITGRIRESRKASEDAVSPFKKVSNALENMRLTVGPLSLSVRGFAIALLALSPIIQSLVGVAGGLAGVLGQGLIGGLGLGGAAVTAFGLAFAGMAGVIASHRKELGFIKKDVSELGTAWRKNTHLPESFGKAIHNAFGTLQSYIPMVGRESSKALDITSKAMDNTRKRFEDPAVRKAFTGIFRDTQKALPGLVNGIGNLGATWLLVTKSFSRAFPSITEGFDKWTQRQFTAAKHSKSLNKSVDEMLASLGAVGDVAKSSGNLLLNFFTAAAPSGRRMLKDISALEQKWADWLSKPKNQKQVQQFLDESWATTKKLAKSIGDVVKGFKDLADIARPSVDKLLDGLNKITGTLHPILGSGFGHGLIAALITGALLSRVLMLTKGLAVFTGRALGINKILSAVNPFRNWKLPKLSEALSEKAPTIKAPSVAKPKAVEVEVKPVVKGDIHIPAGTRKPMVEIEPRIKGGDASKIHIPSGVKKPTIDVDPVPSVGAAGRFSRVMRGALTKENAALAIAGALIDPDTIGAAASEKLPAAVRRGIFQVSKDGRTREALANTWNKLFDGADIQAPGKGATKAAGDQFRAVQKEAQSALSTFKGLSKTGAGQRILFTFATSGDAKVRNVLRSLASTKIGRKILQVVQQGGPAALSALKKLASTKLGRKALQIIQQGGPDVQARLNKLKATTIGNAVKKITENGGSSVQARLNRIKAVSALGNAIKQLTAIDNATATINTLRAISNLGTAIKTLLTIHRDEYTASSHPTKVGRRGGFMGGYAKGGSPMGPMGDRLSRLELMAASKNPPIKAGGPGGKFNRPRFAIGEEPSSEFVIPTNPNYRGRALRLWQQAAQMLHVPGFAKGKKPKKPTEAELEKRRRAKDRPWFKGYQTADHFMGPARQTQREITKSEQDEGRVERVYNIQSDSHPTVNEDGTLNTGNIAWHRAQISSIINFITGIISMYKTLVDQIETAITKMKRSESHIAKHHMKSKWGKSKQRSMIKAYQDGENSAREDKRDALNNQSDRIIDRFEWQDNAAKNEATKPTNTDAAGGSSNAPSRENQVGILSSARIDLFRAFGSNMAPNSAFPGGTLGPPTGGATARSFSGPSAPSIGDFAGTDAAGAGPIVAGADVTGGTSTAQAANQAALSGDGSAQGGFTQINNFAAPPPDPHTFTQTLVHETQNATDSPAGVP